VEGEQDSWMRRLLPLLIGVVVTLVAGCESKKETCAKWAARQITVLEAEKRLGIKNGIVGYCAYYKN